MSDSPSQPELLAPAGTAEAGFAAFDAGADAVYAGLQRFNARERGQNCTTDDVAKLLTYARRKNRRVYVTLNTLIKEGELDAVADMLGELEQIRPHAVIVQDLGVVRMLRECFPALPIHASTQMGVHNSAGVNLLRDLGVQRVILQRQVTMEELDLLVRRAGLDVEVFVHGALCCSRSGHCLFSSWLGGWSGNRGKCKQPCRRRFYTEKGNGFFFSTQDLYMLDAIPDLRAAGVAALKIEGRLRKPDYVDTTVRAYRMMLDAPAGEEHDRLSKARAVLAESFGRKWSRGFRSEADMNQVVDYRSPGVSGLLCGTVEKATKHGFQVRATRPFQVGDILRIQPDSGDEGPAVTVTRLSAGRKSVRTARPGTLVFVHCDADIPARGRVFRIGRRTPDLSGRLADLAVCRRVLDVRLDLTRNRLRAALANVPDRQWEAHVEGQVAQKRPLNAAMLAQEFAATGRDELAAGTITAEVAEGLFLPARDLKALRRRFWDWADDAVSETDVQQAVQDGPVAAAKALIAGPLPRASRRGPARTVRLAPDSPGIPPAEGLTVRGLDEPRPADERFLPDFCPEPELEKCAQQTRCAWEAGIRRFRITSLFGLQVLRDALPASADVTVTGSFPLPVTNSLALAELIENGVSRAMCWVELDKRALQTLCRRCPTRLEIFAYGRLPLLSTRARLPVSGAIRDDHGNRYRLLREGILTNLYPETPLALPVPDGTACYIDLSHTRPGEGPVSSFNYDYDFA